MTPGRLGTLIGVAGVGFLVGVLTPVAIIWWAAYETHYKPHKEGQHHE
jgi:hypothetical protein